MRACDVGETPAERVVDRDAEAELGRDVAFPVLEAAGVRAHLVAVGRDPGHRLQIEERRLEPFEHGAPHIEKAGAARAAQIFPSRGGQHVAADRGDVDRQLADGLAGVEQVEDAVGAGDAPDRRRRIDQAAIGRHMRDGDQLDAVVDHAFKRLDIEFAVSSFGTTSMTAPLRRATCRKAM